MKKSIHLLMAFGMLLMFSCGQGTQTSDEQVDSTTASNALNQNPNLKLQVYYFHSTHRCATCNSIEANVKEVLENNYKNQMSSGIIDFKLINVDEESNMELAKKYEASGMSLRLVQIQSGKETDNDLTEYAMLHSRAEGEIFKQGIKDTIAYFIK